MLHVRSIAASLAVVLVACAPASAPSPAAREVRGFIEEVYAPYVRQDPNAGDATPWSDEMTAKLAEIDARYTRTMNAWGVDYDPVVNSQENFAANIVVGAPVFGENETATVRVQYNIGGEQDLFQDFVLVRQHGAWRISDIRMDGGSFAGEVDHALAQGRAYEACVQRGGQAEC